ncbi:MAG: efflux transporter outer membrane subunit [Chromatiales bacterium]|nr:MAG: efflux transporter outer membrane subunit [Chromatiales bacterium]
MARISTRSIPLCLLAPLWLGGCISLGPDYVEPEAKVETDWQETENARISNAALVDTNWWQGTFSDPVLDGLVDKALQENLSLRSAALRVLQAQQQLRIAIGNQYPQQQLGAGSASKQRSRSNTSEEYELGFNVGWELDLWGRFSRQVESASASLDASVASYDGALVSLVSQVAQTYLLIRTFQQRIVVAEENVKLQEESLRIAQAKFDAGDVSELDVNQADTLLNNTKASVSTLKTSLQQSKNSLAVLLGEPPQDLSYLLGEKADIPATPPQVALGMPQDLIRRRPDILVAERQLAAQSALIGVATTDLYPALSIGGSIGTLSDDTGDLFEGDSKEWDFSSSFQWNLFNYGRLRSNVRLQDALFQQLLVDYLDTVLQAQADVENSIVAYLRSYEQLESYQLAAAASTRAVNIATIQYQEGSIDFDTLITTLNSNVQQQDLFASTQGDVATNLVQVYRALGGGWTVRAGRDPVEFLPASMKDEMRGRTRQWKGVLE